MATNIEDTTGAQLGKVSGGGKRPKRTQSAARVAERFSGAILKVLAGLLVVCVVQSVAIYELASIQRTEPFLMKLNDKQFVEVEPIFDTATASRLAKEAFVRNYVLAREQIDLLSDLRRWNWVREHSDQENVWHPFYDAMIGGGVFKAATKAKESWHIEIVAAYPLEDGNEEKWAVEFTKKRARRNVPFGVTESWLSKIELGRLLGKETDRSKLLKNPLRLAVRSFYAHQKQDLVEGQNQ